MMTSAFFSGEILSKELMENVGTIFNIVLSSANKGEKYARFQCLSPAKMFLTDAGYSKALENQEKGHIKIRNHAKVLSGDLHYDHKDRER